MRKEGVFGVGCVKYKKELSPNKGKYTNRNKYCTERFKRTFSFCLSRDELPALDASEIGYVSG